MDNGTAADLQLALPSPIQELHDERTESRGIRLFLKRDDLIHPDLPGNKWRKLKYNLADAARAGARTLLTFGGAYSHHIRAVAAAGRHFGFATVGVIRGEEHLPLNPTLAFAVAHGMKLTYLDRTTYRDKYAPAVLTTLRAEFGEFFLVPEGGSNAAAVRGVAELIDELTIPYDVVCCGCGTGATLAGIAAGLPPGKRAVGFSALKGGGFLLDEVQRLQREFGRETANWTVELDHHFGGFARRTPELDRFVDDFRRRHDIEPERTYVAKALYGIFDLTLRGQFVPGTSVVMVVTGPPTADRGTVRGSSTTPTAFPA